MADDFKFTDAFKKGQQLGARLRAGDDQVEKEHTALINRINDELSGAPFAAFATIDSLHQGMADANPEDVASPGHGTVENYYIYFGPERSVTTTINVLDDYCKTHHNCEGIGTTPNPYPQFASEGEQANQSPAGQQELNKMLFELNTRLFHDQELPTGLEAEVFKNDFNRRFPRTSMFQARKTESFRAEIFVSTPSQQP